MKYNVFECLRCGKASTYQDWDTSTRAYMSKNHVSQLIQKSYKGIRESAHSVDRTYVCPGCGHVLKKLFIKGVPNGPAQK